jgi:hypothetical protein
MTPVALSVGTALMSAGASVLRVGQISVVSASIWCAVLPETLNSEKKDPHYNEVVVVVTAVVTLVSAIFVGFQPAGVAVATTGVNMLVYSLTCSMKGEKKAAQWFSSSNWFGGTAALKSHAASMGKTALCSLATIIILNTVLGNGRILPVMTVINSATKALFAGIFAAATSYILHEPRVQKLPIIATAITAAVAGLFVPYVGAIGVGAGLGACYFHNAYAKVPEVF